MNLIQKDQQNRVSIGRQPNNPTDAVAENQNETSPVPGTLFQKMINHQDFSANDYRKRSLPASKASTSPIRNLPNSSPVRAPRGLFADATPIKDEESKNQARETRPRHSLTAVDPFMPQVFQQTTTNKA